MSLHLMIRPLRTVEEARQALAPFDRRVAWNTAHAAECLPADSKDRDRARRPRGSKLETRERYATVLSTLLNGPQDSNTIILSVPYRKPTTRDYIQSLRNAGLVEIVRRNKFANVLALTTEGRAYIEAAKAEAPQ